MPEIGTANVKRWDERIARAGRLAAEYPAAADLLTFYGSLAEYQKSLIQDLVVAGPSPLLACNRGELRRGSPKPGEGGHPLDLYPGPLVLSKAKRGTVPFFDAMDFEPVLDAIPDFLSWLQRAAPAPLKKAAGDMRGLERSAWRDLIDSYLLPFEDLKPVTAFIVEAVLQPFAENVARAQNSDAGAGPYSIARAALLGGPATERELTPSAPSSSEGSRCTVCGGRAVVGVLHEEGHGAKRTLICGLCLTERDYLRVVCPGCGEQRFDALPVYTADQFDHVRIEACDSCRTYLKTIDLTKNGLAVPLVDDIASVTMDLWARDAGYARLRPNLLRM